MELTINNIDDEIKKYLKLVNEIKLNLDKLDVIDFLHVIKREKLKTGNYPDVSLFESANRILSDLVLLAGTKYLLNNKKVGSICLPFDCYNVTFGNDSGNDIHSQNKDGKILIGEGFNVAKTFFQTKKSNEIRKLNNQNADYKILIFNSEIVSKPEIYVNKSKDELIFLPISIKSQTF